MISQKKEREFMLKARSTLQEEEEKNLAPYAQKSAVSGIRTFPEEEHPYRLAFQRDKDRIVHCQGFKRLEYKTQVFVYSVGDHYRNRLTHTLEVAGVSRTVAKVLGLNEDLSEAIALAHDLGHSPFGHAGQEALAEIMRGNGGFEHNKQSLRVVQLLERRYPEFSGLNLCYATLMGIMKHCGDYKESFMNLRRKDEGPSLEAQVVDFSDEIAYSSHDIEDGLEKKFINVEELMDIQLWRRNFLAAKQSYPTVKEEIVLRTTFRNILNEIVSNLITTTSKNLGIHKIRELEDIHSAYRERTKLVGFSNTMDEEMTELKGFLLKKLYRHHDVLKMSEQGKETIFILFEYFLKNPNKIPPSYFERATEEGIHRVICDYIAGMTDRYAMEKLKMEGILWTPYY